MARTASTVAARPKARLRVSLVVTGAWVRRVNIERGGCIRIIWDGKSE